MRVVDIIMKKRDGKKLTKDEIEFVIDGYVKGNVPDYQISAFLMAIFFKGMDFYETSILTKIMRDSGDVLDLSEIEGIKVDKHSTGGVGDTTTLVLAPLVAAAGVPVAKMSGRGLGHTGGTLDKLESIPGFSVSLDMKSFIKQVNEIKLSVIGQTHNLVPADKKLYALRDVTATIESIPLIASSIMSKKLAAGADAIVLDVKVGSGAFMKNLKDAKELAKAMVEIGKNLSKNTIALITDMDEPLGDYIGNALEVKEAIEILQNKKEGKLKELSMILAANMLKLAGKVDSVEEGRKLVNEFIINGKGLEKLKQMIKYQGGNQEVVDNLDLLPQAKIVYEFKSNKSGYIDKLNAFLVGKSASILGAGREKKEDRIDPAVGIILNKRVADYVKKGDILAYLHANDEEKLQSALEVLKTAFVIGDNKVEKRPLVYEVIS